MLNVENVEGDIVDKDWYVIHTYSGFEQKVRTNLMEQFERSERKEDLGEIIVPVEEVVEVRKGKKKFSSRKFFPGYVLISVKMSQDVWYMIKNTSKVTGFLGASGIPVPMSKEEVEVVKEQISGKTSAAKPKFAFEKGESVRVVDGPFVNFNGIVDEVNQDKGKVKVMVSIFGRATPVELEFTQVESV
ncbi:MAG: transcription termination/antitermination protein NusG [Nitrospinaceae bacterium]